MFDKLIKANGAGAQKSLYEKSNEKQHLIPKENPSPVVYGSYVQPKAIDPQNIKRKSNCCSNICSLL